MERVVIFQAVFLYRYHHVPFKELDLSITIKNLCLSDYCGNDPILPEIDFSRFKELQSISIGYWSFVYTKKLVFLDLPKLESITIHSFSFSKTKNEPSLCIIQNCLVLTSIQFEEYSCHTFHSLTIQSG